MKGKKQWNTASKWRRLCHQAGQSIQCWGCHTKVNCNNRDDWTQEQLQVILHYPDQGDGEYAADPAYGKSMSYRLLIYVSGHWNFCRKLPQYSKADFAGIVLTLKTSIRNIERYLLHSRSFSLRRNSVLSGFSFSLFDIHDWTDAKHDCKLFSATAESPDAKETYSWLSSA